MSAFWIYKCRSKAREHQRAWGDWADVFGGKRAQRWGTTENIPELAKAKVGDMLLAYQTDRNELVGVARVVRWQSHAKYKRLILKPVRTIGVRVRPLKEMNSKVALIPAFQPGPIHTLYAISRDDVDALLKAAGTHLKLATDSSEESAERASKGAGFGTYEQNKKVEKAAVRAVERHYESKGWSVQDVSHENLGYDLLCKSSGKKIHVEVKGARGDGQQFIITRRERERWTADSCFVLAFVGNALAAKPSLSFFSGAAGQKEFSFDTLSFIAKRKPNLRLERAR